MDTTDLLIIGGIGLAVYFLWRRPTERALVPSVTTEETFTLPYYLDIDSGLFDLPGGIVNQNVSQGISL